MNLSVLIAVTDLLQHASDPDGDPLSVSDLTASSGHLVNNGTEGWTFTPDAGDDTGVTFHYFVTDGHAHVSQTATLDLLPEPSNSAADAGPACRDVG